MHSAEIGLARFGRAITYLVYAFVIIALVILVLGFFLLLFGANPDASFAAWVYRGLNRVMAPFRGIFKTVPINGNSVLDTSVLFAMIIYAMVGLALNALIAWLTRTIAGVRAQEWAKAHPQPNGQPPAA